MRAPIRPLSLTFADIHQVNMQRYSDLSCICGRTVTLGPARSAHPAVDPSQETACSVFWSSRYSNGRGRGRELSSEYKRAIFSRRPSCRTVGRTHHFRLQARTSPLLSGFTGHVRFYCCKRSTGRVISVGMAAGCCMRCIRKSTHSQPGGGFKTVCIGLRILAGAVVGSREC